MVVQRNSLLQWQPANLHEIAELVILDAGRNEHRASHQHHSQDIVSNESVDRAEEIAGLAEVHVVVDVCHSHAKWHVPTGLTRCAPRVDQVGSKLVSQAKEIASLLIGVM